MMKHEIIYSIMNSNCSADDLAELIDEVATAEGLSFDDLVYALENYSRLSDLFEE